MTIVTLIGIVLAVVGAYFLVTKSIVPGLICLIVGLVLLGGGIGLHR